MPKTETLRATHTPGSEGGRARLVEILVRQSLELRDLQLQAKVAHWNVTGLNFHALHAFFDGLVDHLDEWVDMTAERAVTLGGYARGTGRDVADASRLPPYPADAADGAAHLRALAERFGAVAEHLREALAESERVGDPNTVDLLTEVSRDLEKDLWMVEAHLAS